MRPVEKGPAPDVYADYADAKPDLRRRLGDYCSYCERRIETHLAVEHVQPKDACPELENSWDNFLLSCVNCNSTKGKDPLVLTDYFWPHRDNTLRVLQYVGGGRVLPHKDLAAADKRRAWDTIALTGLDKFPANPGREPTDADERWLRRQQALQFASRERSRLAIDDTVRIRELIVQNAVARGMFSIWWTVFEGDVDMRRRLREAFPGTHAGSFDTNENPMPRAEGRS